MKIELVKRLPPIERLAGWIMERESIRKKKEAGEPKPWTDDTILSSYRFCNVRRMDDKVSKWLLENWYNPYFDHQNMLLACALARFINLPSSLQEITSLVFHDNGPLWGSIRKKLRELKKEGAIFNGAYMVRGNDGMDKVECVVDYYVKPLADIVVSTDYMEDAWKFLLPSYGMGSFMAGQIVADLRHAKKGLWEDRYFWAPKGPGSQRGLNRLLERPLKTNWKQADFEEELTNLVDRLEDFYLPEEITQRLELMDYQNCLCEFDKYERALWGEGKPKSNYPGRGE